MTLSEIAREAIARHASGFHADLDGRALDVGGVYAWRAQPEAERHLWNPKSIASLQKAVRLEDAKSYEEYARLINAQASGGTEGAPAFTTLRGMWDFKAPEGVSPVPLDEVEPAKEIVKRFATGAMSFGSISREAHENLAVAMNRIGGKSNTGEGGEDEGRFVRDAKGDLRRSAIKQVASARFGVTTHYLVNADELQIKMAQGAKPGEGGQLPGHKVSEEIARVRHSTPGVTLISPPPHHDIYSIEDLAQLIFDLKNVNPRARISVKLVSESGVGTVAAGVAKAHADHILIAGHDGGTGASPPVDSARRNSELSDRRGADPRPERLRSRVVVQVDGQLKTGRDVAVGALLGAEEFGFATAPLVASGCIMMRKCHLNTCPVGIATQDPELRARFKGTPEHVVNYFFFVAEELRAIMAQLGFRTLEEMVGRVEYLKAREIPESNAAPGEPGWGAVKAKKVDFDAVLLAPQTLAASAPVAARADGKRDSLPPRDANALHCTMKQPDLLAKALDKTVIGRVWASVDRQEQSTMRLAITNADRAFGGDARGEIAGRHGARGLPTDTIRLELTGTAGQSFGAFAGLARRRSRSRGTRTTTWARGSPGASSRSAHPRGRGSERTRTSSSETRSSTARRRARSSPAAAPVSGRSSAERRARRRRRGGRPRLRVHDGGHRRDLGSTGRNFAAGMEADQAYVLDEDGAFASPLQPGDAGVRPLDAGYRERRPRARRRARPAHGQREGAERPGRAGAGRRARRSAVAFREGPPARIQASPRIEAEGVAQTGRFPCALRSATPKAAS